MQTIEAVIDENGKVELLETVRLPQARRALLTILEDEPKKPSEISSSQSLAEKWSNNNELLRAINDAYADDDDVEEKEFLRLMTEKQMQILDEWK